MARALIVEIFGEAKQFGAELDKAAGKTRQFAGAAKLAGVAVAGALAVGLEKSIKVAIEAQQSTARLDQAFKNAGLSAEKNAKQIDAAESAGRKLGFTNEETKNALGSLITATGDARKSVQDLAVAQDLARFKGVDLTDATKMLTMAQAGSQRAAKQLGISVQPVTTAYDTLKATMHGALTEQEKQELAAAKLSDKQATAAEVIATVSEKVKGQGEAFANTAAGGMEQFHAQVGNLEEKVGTALLPVLTRLLDFINNSAIPALGRIGSKIGDYLSPIVQDLGTIFKTSVEKIRAVVDAHMPEIRQIFDNVGQVIKDIAQVAIPILKFTLEKVLPAAIAIAIPIIKGLTTVLKAEYDVIVAIADAAKATFGALKKIVEGAIAGVKSAVGALKGPFDALLSVLNAIKTAAEDAFAAAQKVTSLPSKAAGGITGAIGGALGHIPGISHIPGFASGGIVPGPVGSPLLAVVHGGERIIPNGGSGGGDVILNVYGFVGSEQQLANTVRRELQRQKRSSIGLGLA